MKDFILLIPYFNDTEGLVTSLKSINYPPDKFEVLIVDDGSQPALDINTLKTAISDITIRVLNLVTNVGIAKALNTGLKELYNRKDYKYIARLDCGDTCHPARFTEQVKFMDGHSDVALLGTWCRFTDSITKKSYLYKTKTEHTAILKEMHFKCSFIHPTVMFRRDILDTIGYYPENYPHAEDYAYFWNILKHFKGSILPVVYVDIVSDMQTISAKNFNKQALSRARIIKAMGTHPLLKYIGSSSAYIRMIIPYNLIIKLKLLLYK